MTEFETASLALREATLFTSIAHVSAALLIGLGQIGIVHYGIRTMQKMGDQRAVEADKKHDQIMDTLEARDRAEAHRHTETMQANADRHQEAMTALQELIRRTAGPQTA